MNIPVWPDEMVRFLKLKVEKDGGPAEFSRKHNVNLPNLVQMIEGKRPIPDSVASSLGYEKRTVYVRPLKVADWVES